MTEAARLEGVIALVGLQQAQSGLVGLGRQVDKTQTSLDGLATGTRGTGQGMRTLAKDLDSAGRRMQATGGTLTRRMTLPLVGLGLAAVKVGSDFEAQMSKVEAKSGASAQQLERLRQQALRLGADTSFSAREAAQGMEELAAAGMKPQQVLAAMPGLLDAAAASGEGVAQVASIMSNSLAQFSLEADQSGRIADVLAKASNETQGSITSMGEALKYAGTGASQMGLDIEQTTALLSKMVKAGIDGGQAGTALRMGLLKLATVPPARALEKLADPKFGKLGDIWKSAASVPDKLKQMSGEMEKLDGTSRAAAAGIIFGSEASTGMLEAMRGGPAAIDKWTESMRNAGGEAKRMGETMRNNLRGDLEGLGGSLETALIGLFSAGDGPMRQLAQSATELVNAFSGLDPAFQQVTVLVGLAGIAIGPLLVMVGMMASGLSVLAAAAATVSAPFIAIGVGIAAAGASMILLYRNSETVRLAVSRLWEVVKVHPMALLLRAMNSGAQSVGGWKDVLRYAGIAALGFGILVTQMALSVTRSINTLTSNWLGKFAGILKAVAFVRPEFGAAADAVEAMASRSKSGTSEMERAMQNDIQAMRNQIAMLKRDIAGIPSSKSVSISVRINRSGGKGLPSGPSTFVGATGGAVHGPGTGTSDEVPALLSNGEHVVTAKEVRAMGGHEGVERWRNAALTGVVRFAAGGAVGKRPVKGRRETPKAYAARLRAWQQKYAEDQAGRNMNGARFDASNADPVLVTKRDNAAAALRNAIIAQDNAVAGKAGAASAAVRTAAIEERLQARYDAAKGPAKAALKKPLANAKAAAKAAQARYDKILDTIRSAGDKRRGFAADVVRYEDQLSGGVTQREREGEDIRREALGLESVEEEKRRNAINLVRAANGLTLLNRGDTLNDDGTITRATSGGAGGSNANSPDLAAQIEQQRRRADAAEGNLRLSEGAIRAFGGPGDIGYGRGGSAIQSAAPTIVVQSLTGYSPEIQQVVADAAGGGFAAGGNSYRMYSGRG